jgi:DNA modification methylase
MKFVSIDSLHPSPWNPRLIKDARFQSLCKSIESDPEFMELRPVLATKSGEIYAGNMRYRAAKHLGWEKVPAIITDISEAQAKERAIKDNNQFGEWDDTLSVMIDELSKGGVDVSTLGLSESIVDALKEPQVIVEDDVPPVSTEARSKRGELYQLGNHRLLCGDSTNKGDVERLMNGESADLLLTDPPYGLSYVDKNELFNVIDNANRLVKRIENDHKTPEEMYDLWSKTFGIAYASLKDVSSYYVFSPQNGDLFLLLLQALRTSGLQFKHVLIWAKNKPVLSRCDYNYQHEPIAYGWKQDGTHEFYGKGEFQTSVWEYDRPLKNDLHPTMKPIGVLCNAILNSSKERDIVLDLFGGSGSTLIACEQLNRKCYMMEIDPKYVDVIITRWETLTGKKATLLSHG